MKKKASEKLANILRSRPVAEAAEILVSKIGDIQYPADDIEEDINILRIMERTFSVKNKGLKLKARDIKPWTGLFKRCEEILELSDLSPYAQVIMRETIGHRYADIFRLCKRYEDKMNASYGKSFELASIHNFYAHKDASSFWHGTAYYKCGKIAKSAPFFARVVVSNRLEFNQVRMHRLKIEASYDFFIKHPEYTPEHMKDGVEALVSQNKNFKEVFGKKACIPDTRIKTYKKRWL